MTSAWGQAFVRADAVVNGQKLSMGVTTPASVYEGDEKFREAVHRDLANRMGVEIAKKLMAEDAIKFSADIPKTLPEYLDENGL